MTRRLALRDERGGVMVLVALTLPLIVLFLVFVLDVGNWWTHDRHLQTQADAAALAAADAVTYPCDAAAAEAEGRRYGDAPYNEQIGNANKGPITLLFNSATYANGAGPDDTLTGDICSTGVVDVKATESNLPLFFGNVVPDLGVVPAVNAHARVEIRMLQSMKGMLPLAVPDTSFHYLFAQFLRAGTTTPVAGCANDCTVLLNNIAKGTPTTTLYRNDTPISLPVNTAGTSVRLIAVYAEEVPDPLTCSSNGVSCFNNVNFVRGYGAGTPGIRDVRLLPGTCGPDGYFVTSETCSLGVSAVIDLGKRAQSGAGITTTVDATIQNDNKSHALDPVGADPGTGGQTWTLAGGLPLDHLNTNTVAVSWSWKKVSGTDPETGTACTAKAPCTAEGSEVAQRTYLSDPTMPFELVQLGDAPLGSGANSFEGGTTHDLYVQAGVLNSVQAASTSTDPTILLRFASGSGSGNQAVDCDANVNLHDEVVEGCVTPYQINVTGACPNADDPASCVPTQTGDAVGQIRQGLADRFAPYCAAGTFQNNWQKDVPGWTPAQIEIGDPRLVALLIVPWASFETEGTHLLPILQFAYFYVTGWDGDEAVCPGTGNEPPPAGKSRKGDIWGHFYAYRGQVPDGLPGDDMCDLKSSDPGVCLPVLTR